MESQLWLFDYGVHEMADIDGVVSNGKDEGRGRRGLQPDIFSSGLLMNTSQHTRILALI